VGLWISKEAARLVLQKRFSNHYLWNHYFN